MVLSRAPSGEREPSLEDEEEEEKEFDEVEVIVDGDEGDL